MRKLITGFIIIAWAIFAGCAPSTDAGTTTSNDVTDLCAIILSEGTLEPSFSAETTSYTVNVANAITGITIKGVPANVYSGVSEPVELTTLEVDKPKTSYIFVTSKSGSYKAYSVTVRRAPAESSNANLRGITLSSGSLTTSFSSATTSYEAKLLFDEPSVTISGLKSDSEATVSDPITLTNFTVGVAQTATITVTAKDATTKEYTVAVTKQEDVKTQLTGAALTTPEKLFSGVATNSLAETPLEEPVVTVETDENDPKVRYRVTTQKKTASASYDQSNILKPDTDVIYPGSVLLGQSIDDGSYLEVTSGVKRPVNISYSLSGILDGVINKSLVPSLSATRAFHNEVMSQDIPGQSIYQFQFESTEVNTEEALSLKINAGVTYSGVVEASVKAGYSYEKSNTKNKFLVKFSQTFYTVDIDQAGDKFLYESFDVTAFKGYRPVYVASVAYGRVGFLSVETTLDKKAFETTLAAACSYGPWTVEADVAVAKTKLNETSTIKINLIGGSTSPTSLESFMEEIRNGGFSENNRGVIIAYKLRYVDDNSIANVKFTGDYTSRSSVAYTGITHVGLKVTAVTGTDNESGGMEIYGKVNYLQGGIDSIVSKTLWDHASNNLFEFADGSVSYGGTEQIFDFYSGTDQITITVRDLYEADSTSGDDSLKNVDYTKMVSEIEEIAKIDGTFTVRSEFSGDSGQYVEFTIKPTVSITYNE